MKLLSECHLGNKVIVNSINENSTIKRRFLDLGIIPGTIIECALKSPSGDPYAYDIRGSLIAIRSEDAKNILVEDYYE